MNAANSIKNSYIELERFIACMGILFFHLNILDNGWIFVEFFFILTGFFAMRHFAALSDEKKNQTWYPLSYTVKKFKTVFPYTTISILVIWVLEIFIWHLKGKGLIKWLLYLPTNILLLSGFGVQFHHFELQDGVMAPRMLNPHLWYICSMLVAVLIAGFIFQYAKKSRLLLFTVLPFVLYGILIFADGTISSWHDHFLGFFALDLRALAGILTGAFSWQVSSWLKTKTIKKRGILFLLTSIEVLCFAFVFILAGIHTLPYEFLCILLFFASVTITMSELSYTSLIRVGLFNSLGKLSLPVYCFQYAVGLPIINFFPDLPRWTILPITLVVGLIVMIIIESVKKLRLNK